MIINDKFSGVSKFILKKVFGIDVDMLSSEWQMKEEHLQLSLSQCEVKNKNIFALRQENTSLTSRLESLKKEVIKYQQRSETLQTTLTENEISLKKLLADLDEQKNQKSSINKELSTLQVLLAEKENSIKGQKEKLNSCESELATSNEKVNSLQKTLADIRIELEECNSKFAVTNEDLSSAQTELANTKSELEELNSKLLDSQQQAGDLKRELNDACCELTSLREELTKEKSSNTSLAERIEELGNALMTNRETAEASKKKEILLSEKLIKIEKELSDSKTEIEHYQENISVLNSEKGELSKRLVELQNAIKQLRQEHSDNNSEERNQQVKALVEQLHDAEREKQILDEKLCALTAEKKEIVESAKEQKESDNKKLEQLNGLLLQRDNEIASLKDRIKNLEELLSKRGEAVAEVVYNVPTDVVEEEPLQNNEHTDTPKPVPDKVFSEEDSDNNREISHADLPTQGQEDSVITKRSIKRVKNYWTDEFIESDDFFRQPQDVILRISRRLEAISKTGDLPYLLCGQCFKPVKISKISTLHGETRFFTHCSHEVECEWSTKAEDGFSPYTPINDNDIVIENESLSRYTRLKQLIFDVLSKNVSNEGNTISSVKANHPVRGEVDGRKWRRADVSFLWNGKKVVIKLQRSSDSTSDLQAYDDFCKRNGIYIIWIFGAESGSNYFYLLEHNYQFTFYDNRTCVFILDNEAEQKCLHTGKLYLKCNWLIDSKHWRYTQENAQSNGILASLDDLVFEEGGNYKPYHKELLSNSEIESGESILLKEDVCKIKVGAFWQLYNKKVDRKSAETYKDIYIGKDGRIFAETKDYLHPRKGVLNDLGEEIESFKAKLSDEVYLLCTFERWYLISPDGNILTKVYESLMPWDTNRLVAKDEKGFFIINHADDEITTRRYKSLEILNSNRAKVEDFEGSYEIDHDGNIIPDATVALQDGFMKVQHLGKWGIADKSGKLVANYVYDEIVSFRIRFYGFKDGKISKLEASPEYGYRIPFVATFKKRTAGGFLFDYKGIKMYMPDNDFNRGSKIENGEYCVYVLNIEMNEDKSLKITIAMAPDNIYKMKFNHVDKDSDFSKKTILHGKITKELPLRFYFKFPDGKESEAKPNPTRPTTICSPCLPHR